MSESIYDASARHPINNTRIGRILPKIRLISKNQGVARVPGTPKVLTDLNGRGRRTGFVLEDGAEGAIAVEPHEDVTGVAYPFYLFDPAYSKPSRVRSSTTSSMDSRSTETSLSI